MRQHELEADQERGGERGELDRRSCVRGTNADDDGAEQDGDLQRGLEDVQVGEAGYSSQSQIENGDERDELPAERPVPEDARRVQRVGLEQQHPEARAPSRAAKPPTKRQLLRGRSGAVGIGRPERQQSRARELRPGARPTKSPRAGADVTSQRPQISSAGMIASFEFELDTYCVNG